MSERLAPHIYSEQEIVDLLAAARRLGPAPGLRGAVFEALFGLIACTGLRISEALALRNADVDLKHGMLTVLETKFTKSRQVPMHRSAVEALRRYRSMRDLLSESAQEEAPFFIGTRGRRRGLPLSDRQVHRVFADLRKYPKLVGGIDDVAAARAEEFYAAVLEFDDRPDLARPNGVWNLGSAEAAEMAKLAETTYRDVNIGLANEFGRFAASHGIDVYQVIEASNSQPFSHIHTPGIAVGGHCIPVYPRLYLWNDPDATIVRAARAANASMPVYAVGVLEGAHGDLNGQRVVVLGASYRGAVKETAFSGVFPLVDALRERGAVVTVHDPMYEDAELEKLGFTPYQSGSPVDAAVLQTDHAVYRELGPADLPGVRTIVDGRAALPLERWDGVTVRVLGRG